MSNPSDKWSDDQIEEMLARMATGETLTSIANDPRMPSFTSMNRWEAEEGSDLAARITRAREIGYLARAEKIIGRVQAGYGDGEEKRDAALERLAFDAERWFLGKMQPKRFGDKTLIGSDPANPLPAAINIGFRET